MPRSARACLQGFALCLLFTGCWSSRETHAPAVAEREASEPRDGGALAESGALDRAIARAIAYADGITNVATLQALLQYVHRRFGVSEFADARARYDRAASAPADRVFRRIIDRNTVAARADLAALTDTDLMVSAALYCDIIPLPPDYATVLGKARRAGGYSLTHVLLSLDLLRENGGTDVVTPGYEDSVARDVAALVAPWGPPTDLEIEAEALLYLVGRADLVQPGFADRLVKAQKADGGFSQTGHVAAASNWHASGLALWVLLSCRYPTAPLTGLLDRR